MIEIKHKYTGEVLYTHNGDTLSEADLRWADLSGANLRWADLSGANLRDANLPEANLCGANLHEANLSGADLLWANLRGADLSGANLSGANLRRADLSGADLRFAIGDGEIVRTMQLPGYVVVSCNDWLAIGCEAHRVHEWREFDDEAISAMDDGALEWWREWKGVVLAFADCP